jgi:hypothetical protein
MQTSAKTTAPTKKHALVEIKLKDIFYVQKAQDLKEGDKSTADEDSENSPTWTTRDP